jgi:hypothetical protein
MRSSPVTRAALHRWRQLRIGEERPRGVDRVELADDQDTAGLTGQPAD